MNDIKAWVSVFSCAAFICTFIEFILPDKNKKTIVNSVISGFFLLTILMPLQKIVSNINLIKFSQEYNNNNICDFENKKLTQRIFKAVKKDAKSKILEILNKKSITPDDIIIDINENSEKIITKIKLNIRFSKMESELEEIIKKELKNLIEIHFEFNN
ncbi:MAG: stage III sporulation protein AF [Candidatus Improbicoccus devescovinae]|nr:MAG: stage III sporulation protein AF [Candidatus Improbicoccus devescovinae]